MKRRLVLVRHGKSLYNDYVKNDSERHLAERGYDDVAATAQWLIDNNLYPDYLVTSPAIRAFSTCLIVANALSVSPSNIKLNNSIYNASDSALMYVINESPDEASTVFLFGHNPGFTNIVSLLTGIQFRHLPTSAAAVIEFENLRWNEINFGCGLLTKTFCCHKNVD